MPFSNNRYFSNNTTASAEQNRQNSLCSGFTSDEVPSSGENFSEVLDLVEMFRRYTLNSTEIDGDLFFQSVSTLSKPYSYYDFDSLNLLPADLKSDTSTSLMNKTLENESIQSTASGGFMNASSQFCIKTAKDKKCDRRLYDTTEQSNDIIPSMFEYTGEETNFDRIFLANEDNDTSNIESEQSSISNNVNNNIDNMSIWHNASKELGPNNFDPFITNTNAVQNDTHESYIGEQHPQHESVLQKKNFFFDELFMPQSLVSTKPVTSKVEYLFKKQSKTNLLQSLIPPALMSCTSCGDSLKCILAKQKSLNNPPAAKYNLTREEVAMIPCDEAGRLLSLGSIYHNQGRCRPCAFINNPKKKVCTNGISCYFCHYIHQKKKVSRLTKIQRSLQKLERQLKLHNEINSNCLSQNVQQPTNDLNYNMNNYNYNYYYRSNNQSPSTNQYNISPQQQTWSSTNQQFMVADMSTLRTKIN